MKLDPLAIGLWTATAFLLASPPVGAAPDSQPTDDEAGWGLPQAPSSEAPADEAPTGEGPPDASHAADPSPHGDAAVDAEAGSRQEGADDRADDAPLETIPHDLEPIPQGAPDGDGTLEPTPDRPPLRLREKGGPAPESAEADEWAPRPGQLGITVGVPFYDESILHGDMTVDVRYGRKFGWLVPYVSGGFRQTRLDPARVPDHARRKKLEAWHVTLGLRLEIPASRHLFPFVGVAGEMTRWGFQADTAEYCNEPFYPDAWRCYERYRWKPGRAVKPQLGLIYKPEPSLALEFWVERGVVDAPEMFTRRVTFINPALGFAWHH